MGKIDIAIIILGLLFLLIGYIRGFVKQISGFVATIAAFVITMLFYKQVASLLKKTPLYDGMLDKIQTWITGKGGVFSTKLSAISGAEGAAEALKGKGLPSFIQNVLTKPFESIASNPEYSKMTLGEYVSPVIANMLIQTIAYALLMAVAFIVIRLILLIFKGIADSTPAISQANRILGMVWGGAVFFIIVCILFMVFPAIGKINGDFDKFVIADLKLNQDGFSIGKLIYQNNPLVKIMSKIGFDGIVSKVFP